MTPIKYLVVQDLGLIPFRTALLLQSHMAGLVRNRHISDHLLFAEHPHTFSVGRAAKQDEIIWNENERAAKNVVVEEGDRGGAITYHGPGQLVAYPIVWLGDRPDLHRYLRDLENTLISTLASFGISAERREGLTGVWVDGEKIASIGVKYSRCVARHGVSLNVSCDLSYFDGIIACGLSGDRQTSLNRLGLKTDAAEVAKAYTEEFADLFGYRVKSISNSIASIADFGFTMSERGFIG